MAGGRRARLHGRRGHLQPGAARSLSRPVRAPRDLALLVLVGSGCHFAFMLLHVATAERRDESPTRRFDAIRQDESPARRRAQRPHARGPGFVGRLARRLRAARESACWPTPARAPASASSGRAARLSAGDRGRSARASWTVAPAPADLERPPGGDHRAGRAQDDDQRAQLGRAGLHGGLRGRALAALDQRGRRPARTAWTRCAARWTTPAPRASATGWASGSPRWWCGRAGGTSTRSTCWWTARPCSASSVRLRPLLLPQRPRAAGPRQRALLLPAQAGEPPRGPALERGVRGLPRRRSGIPRGTIRATVLIETILAAFEMDEILYELRDARRRAQRRPLGLPLQHHQEIPATGPSSSCPTAPSSR